MMEHTHSEAISALQQFRAARLQGNLEKIQAALSGKSADLLSYEDVRSKVNAQETNLRELKDIPLDAIAGSVGRYADFTRRFFPVQEENENRWTRVRLQAERLDGLPPIEAYQLGEAYFVIDGNHRVSVARSLGATYIEGYVTHVDSSVPLSAGANADELILAERYTRFLENTQLKEFYPTLDLSMSAAGNYRFLEQQIKVHQEWKQQPCTFQEAARDWYQSIYLPVIHIIRQRGMLRDFPDRTETDLFVWIEKHRQEVIQNLGWSLKPETIAAELVDQYSQALGKQRRISEKKLRETLTPEALQSGPMPGEWRNRWQQAHTGRTPFSTHSGRSQRAQGWLECHECGSQHRQRDNGSVYGLHVRKKIDLTSPDLNPFKSFF